MDRQIEARNVTLTPEWEAKINAEISRLEEHHPGTLHHFRFVLTATRHQRLGLFEIKLVASVPQDSLVINHKGEEVLPLIIKCFDILDHEIKEYERRRQREVKTHESHPTGTVTALFPMEDYGLIDSVAGDSVYFHRNAVQDSSFEDLQVGDPVIFGAGMGNDGPQATWVRRR